MYRRVIGQPGKPESTRDGVILRPVESRGNLTDFIKVPHHVYKDDPAWVPPLNLERRLHISPRHNPYFKHARWQGWVAYRDGRPVGRITAQLDELMRERYGEDRGEFGFLEAIDDPGVFRALVGTAEDWLKERGVRRVRGPFSFSINQESGLLVEGFQHPPMIMMGHARPYYRSRLEELGYRKAKDLLAYWVSADSERPRVMVRLVRRFGDRIRVRPLDRRRLDQEMALLLDIFNEAWADNWGFVPFTEAEFEDLGNSLRLLVPDELVQIAEVEGEGVAFIVALPNVNEVIDDLGGRLLPLGWTKLLWRVWRKRMTTARVALMGVRSRYQRTPMGAALAFSVVDRILRDGRELGYWKGELSWILEDNTGMRDILEALGATVYKRYRVFEKTLEPTPSGA